VFYYRNYCEVDFIEIEANFKKNTSILDIGCGAVRHSVELVKRGYTLTGINLSESQRNLAKEKAIKNNLKMTF
jgi:cyclopropane fatty-acyl-phospholipid synthase-like methyltransferase